MNNPLPVLSSEKLVKLHVDLHGQRNFQPVEMMAAAQAQREADWAAVKGLVAAAAKVELYLSDNAPRLGAFPWLTAREEMLLELRAALAKVRGA